MQRTVTEPGAGRVPQCGSQLVSLTTTVIRHMSLKGQSALYIRESKHR